MRLGDLSRCLAQETEELLELAEGILGISRARLLVEGVDLGGARALLETLLGYPKGYPVPYILGRVPFYGKVFLVDERVLIPRSETEGLIDIVLSLGISPKRIVDVGTGSGVLGITLKLLFPDALVILTDLSPDALKVAKRNALRLGAEVRMVATDLLAGLRGEYDLIVSNPPYVAEGEVGIYDPRVRFEPEMALRGGRTGYEITERLVREAMGMLSPGGYLIFESDPKHFHRLPAGAEIRGRFVILKRGGA
ncbi:MAG: peptide chain release factor N(5)-glutamine methyltransferase [Thermotogae bacterium]|nr:peptide chain release factor N(5)-glutamine methyltransferase [Thermotogota bacterium]